MPGKTTGARPWFPSWACPTVTRQGSLTTARTVVLLGRQWTMGRGAKVGSWPVTFP